MIVQKSYISCSAQNTTKIQFKRSPSSFIPQSLMLIFCFYAVMILKHQQQHCNLWHAGGTLFPNTPILIQNWFCLVMIIFSIYHCLLSFQTCQSQCFSSQCFLSPPSMHTFIHSILKDSFLSSCTKGSLHFERTSMFDKHQWTLGKINRKRYFNISQWTV